MSGLGSVGCGRRERDKGNDEREMKLIGKERAQVMRSRGRVKMYIKKHWIAGPSATGARHV